MVWEDLVENVVGSELLETVTVLNGEVRPAFKVIDSFSVFL